MEGQVQGRDGRSPMESKGEEKSKSKQKSNGNASDKPRKTGSGAMQGDRIANARADQELTGPQTVYESTSSS